MFLGANLRFLMENVYASYNSLPDEGKLIVYIIFILLLITIILLIIMLEQKRINKRIAKRQAEVSENTEVLDFDLEDIDETNEKTRNLKEITDKIQAAIDNKNIDLTKFEQDQEETSIISYAELMNSVGKKEEEPEQDFSLSNLVHKIEADEEIEKEEPFVAPVKDEKESKFKSSIFISPVFGVQPDPARKIIKEEPTPVALQEEAYIPIEHNEEEMFLTNLINFRKNLE